MSDEIKRRAINMARNYPYNKRMNDEEALVAGIRDQNIKYEKLLNLVKRASKNSCCICCDSCLSCDAMDLLKELGEWKDE